MKRAASDLAGQRFGRLTVLERMSAKSGGHLLWWCRCDCGKEIAVRGDSLKSGRTASCGCARQDELSGRARDITGRRFGSLTVLHPLTGRRRGSVLWLCRCDCGREVPYTYGELCYSGVASCGCSRKGRGALDLTGRRFGRLTALERLDQRSGGAYLWRCRCDCGREVNVRSSALTGGNTVSCGCARQDALAGRARDIASQRFGSLTALHPLAERRRGSVMWLCRCDCGRECAYTYNELMYSAVRSCGCRRRPNLPGALHYVDGTCIEQLQRGLRSDNTSGYTGVVRTKSGWRAQICFRGRNYYLGTYRDVGEAAAARRAAEQQTFDAFLDWYRAAHPGAERPQKEIVNNQQKRLARADEGGPI